MLGFAEKQCAIEIIFGDIHYDWNYGASLLNALNQSGVHHCTYGTNGLNQLTTAGATVLGYDAASGLRASGTATSLTAIIACGAAIVSSC